MAKTLTQIQTSVRFYGRDENITLTTGTGLVIANSMYRALASLLPWSEFRKTTDLPATTTSGTGTYNWISATTAVYTDVKAFEIGNDASNTQYILQIIPETELEWNQASKDSNRIPSMYMRYNDAGTDKVEIRPIPNYSSATMKVTGITEPTALVNGSSTTEFLLSSADDALAHLIAAAYLERAGMGQNIVQANIQRATEILQSLFANEELPVESIRALAGA
jgi:hypothetical protein